MFSKIKYDDVLSDHFSEDLEEMDDFFQKEMDFNMGIEMPDIDDLMNTKFMTKSTVK